MVISTSDLHEEISDLAAPRDRDAFEDEGKMHEAVFAELGLPLAIPTLSWQKQSNWLRPFVG